uniref:glutathione transferase n=1 Tax=Mythimna separata TaxID=271217 RepID=A0A9E9GTV6_MYTSE|nr:glutathione S-transferase [Mythimna separata]
MSESKPVFYYFKSKALGEQSRLLMVYGGIDFEDYRVDYYTEWADFKSKTKFGFMPMLEIGGKQYAQSLAISRYLARRVGLAGDTLEEALEIDQNIDLFNEFRLKASDIFFETDEAVKERKYAEAVKNVFPDYLEKLSNIINENNGHLALGKLTWADFVLTGTFLFLKMITRIPDLEKKYPAFQRVLDNVYSIPQIKAYAEKAPVTDY